MTRAGAVALGVMAGLGATAGAGVLLAGSLFYSTAALPRPATQETAAICAPHPGRAYANPLAGTITSTYGPRPNPFGPGVVPPGFTSEEPLVHHHGVDIAGVPAGTPFVSATAGVVKAVNVGGEPGGNGIIITHDARTEIWYWHAQPGTTGVTVGQQVTAGTVLAGVGASGAATGGAGAPEHLHLEIQVDGRPVDPAPWLGERGITLGADPAHPSRQGPAEQHPAPPPGASAAGESLTLPGPEGPVTFTPTQLDHAAVIIRTGGEGHVPEEGIVIALMTALTESGLQMSANLGVPASLDHPHQVTGADHDSLGLFQQRPSHGWGSVAELMDPADSARAFYGGAAGPNRGNPAGLLDIDGWQRLRPAEAAQTVQRSARPGAYGRWEPAARTLLDHLEGTASAACTTSGSSTGAPLRSSRGVARPDAPPRSRPVARPGA